MVGAGKLICGRMWRVGAALSGVLLTVPGVALACPMCQAAVEQDPVMAALNATTLLMIAVPLLLVGSIGGWVFSAYRRSARAESAGSARPRVLPEGTGLVWEAVGTEREN
ncbi:MAG: hypothetical protein ACE5I7_04660 [Candidatus Binatia bacterium]